MLSILATSTILGGLLLAPAQAATFVNGGFEAGDFSGWTLGGTSSPRSVNNSGLTPATIGTGDTSRSTIINTAYVDPNLGAALGSTIYNGNYSWRVENTVNGGYASDIQQQVLNYTDNDIFFEWKAVLEAAHDAETSATMKIILTDTTTGTDVITRIYNAATGTGGGAPFSFDGRFDYTPNWQVEHLDLAALGLIGDDFLLTVIGSDCQPTGHMGYVDLDGFAPTVIPPGVPEPASLALLGAGLLGLTAARRKRR